jgi:uncharacterized phage protein (TIGR01671 family)
MRDIKFRAWDKLNKKMYPNPFNGKLGGMNDIFSNTGDWIYMQYTGLKDKNGVDIYEGAVVDKFDFQDPYFRSVVVRHLGAFCYESYGAFIVFTSDYHFKWANGKSEAIEVIGNIYENPELTPSS